MKTGDIEGLI